MSENNIATILCSAYDSGVSKLLEAALRGAMGYNVISVSNCDEAIPQVPLADLVLSDINNGGYKLADYVSEHFKGLPVVLMSSCNPDTDKIKNAIFLAKPFSLVELEVLLNRIIPQNLKPKQKQ